MILDSEISGQFHPQRKYGRLRWSCKITRTSRADVPQMSEMPITEPSHITPQVSVIIPAFNRAGIIKHALDSLSDKISKIMKLSLSMTVPPTIWRFAQNYSGLARETHPASPKSWPCRRAQYRDCGRCWPICRFPRLQTIPGIRITCVPGLAFQERCPECEVLRNRLCILQRQS